MFGNGHSNAEVFTASTLGMGIYPHLVDVQHATRAARSASSVQVKMFGENSERRAREKTCVGLDAIAGGGTATCAHLSEETQDTPTASTLPIMDEGEERKGWLLCKQTPVFFLLLFISVTNIHDCSRKTHR